MAWGLDVIKHDQRGPCLTLCCDVIGDVINTKDNISCFIWHVDFKYAIKFELCWKLTKIEIAISHFRFSTSGDFFKPEVIAEVDDVTKMGLEEYYILCGFFNFAAARKLTELRRFLILTFAVTSWPWPLTSFKLVRVSVTYLFLCWWQVCLHT